MTSPLDNYLAQINDHLDTLPTRRRDAELRELRAYLEQTVASHQGEGQSRLQAEYFAIEQIGEATAVAGRLLRIYQRQRTSPIHVVGAVILSFVTDLWLLPIPAILAQLLRPVDGGSIFGQISELTAVIAGITVPCVMFGAAGAVIGFLFPRGAVLGIVIALILLAVYALVYTAIVRSPYPANHRQDIESTVVLVVLEMVRIVVAWAVSRWRVARIRYQVA